MNCRLRVSFSLPAYAACGLILAAGGWISAAQAAEPALLLQEDFEEGADRWQPTDDAGWELVDTDRGKVYSQARQSNYKPPHRSPVNISLVRDLNVGSFVLEADVKSTARDYPHRSCCMFFGYQDPAHFYYVHFGQRTDDHANQIFIVNDAPRTKISTKTTPGTPWDNQWHHVKIVRDSASGAIEVYFDDMKNPVMKAVDKTFIWGRIGVGSFDDTGHWDNITLRGEPADSGTSSDQATNTGESKMSAESRLAELKDELPPAPKPAGVYRPVVVSGNMAYVSGHGPLKPDGTMYAGKVGGDVDIDGGYAAARQTGMAILATLKAELGDLDRVERLVKTFGMVNATSDFTEHPKVINGYSDLMAEVFGPEAGIGARSAVGMGSLPGNISVEIEAIFEIKP